MTKMPDDTGEALPAWRRGSVRVAPGAASAGDVLAVLEEIAGDHDVAVVEQAAAITGWLADRLEHTLTVGLDASATHRGIRVELSGIVSRLVRRDHAGEPDLRDAVRFVDWLADRWGFIAAAEDGIWFEIHSQPSAGRRQGAATAP